MKKVTWECDSLDCDKRAEGYVIPYGWLECSFYNGRWYRYCFCSYSHLSMWCEKRDLHYQDRFLDEGVLANER